MTIAPVYQTSQPVVPYSPVEIPEDITGITVTQTGPDVSAIFVAAPKNWRSLRSGLLVMTFASSAVAFLLLGSVLFGRMPFDEAAGILVDSAVVAVIGWLVCLHRLYRRLGFEISPYALRVTTAGPFGVSRTHWSRCRIADVHINPNNYRLVVKLIKEAPAEIFVTPDRDKTRRVLDELISAMTSIPAAPRDRQLLPADPSAGMQPSKSRTILQRIGICLTIAALVCIPFTAGVSLVLLLPAGIFFGIALGTQTNKSYL